MSSLQVQHIYSVHAACLVLVLGDSSWIERLLTAKHPEDRTELCPKLFTPLGRASLQSTCNLCRRERSKLSLSRATVLISVSSAERPTHIYGIHRMSSVILSSSIIYLHLNRVCPVRDHNQCHIPFERLRAQNEQPSEGKPEKKCVRLTAHRAAVMYCSAVSKFGADDAVFV